MTVFAFKLWRLNNYHMKKIVFVLAIVCLSISSFGQTELKRQADPGFTVRKLPDTLGAVVTNVIPGTPASKIGLLKGDRILAINDTALTDKYVMLKAMRRLKGNEPVKLHLLRKGLTQQQVRFTPLPAPYEIFTSVTLEPLIIINDYGSKLRAFLSKPKATAGKLPTILFVSWLSCSTVETVDTTDNWAKMLRDVAEKSGCIFLRLEKPGVGDSEGTACSDCDLQTELNGYEAALRYLKNRPDVDTTKIVLFGGSLGGTLTSVVGRQHNIKAYVSAVSTYKTWLEHMIELERRRLQLSGESPGITNSMMPGYIEFHTDYLTKSKTPAQVLDQKPQLKPLWYDDPKHQYGRPAAFHHQVQDLNSFNSWNQVQVPVLLIAGEYDWIMSLDDNRILHDMLNEKNPNSCTLYIAPQMDHHWTKYSSPKEAFDEVKGEYDRRTVDFLIRWIKEKVR